jgi:hypothetical protein
MDLTIHQRCKLSKHLDYSMDWLSIIWVFSHIHELFLV